MIVDLTVNLNNNTPVYPGDPKIVIKQADSLDKDGYLGHSLAFGTHAGTHIDAPAHMLAATPTLGQIPLETMTNLAPLLGKEFTVYALPLKLNLDGAPARVIAVIHDA